MDVAVNTFPRASGPRFSRVNQRKPKRKPLSQPVILHPLTQQPVLQPEQTVDVSIAIQHLVQRIFTTGHLSHDDESQLRELMTRPYCRDTFRLLISLQKAAQSGSIIQTSRQLSS